MKCTLAELEIIADAGVDQNEYCQHEEPKEL
jgi:hypothetical protein